MINIFALISKDLLSENKIILKAGGGGGERIKKNGFAEVRAYDYWRCAHYVLP
ncbi:MAG: hypothetical protein KJ808_03585 [Acidobacteria bacterium]|nr:hypothetical protein [Acidobacteriota bacterium]MBU4404571.1 hypothetical protein [Acidobacteriota bacterium]MCG2809852.1 hypothetical protein [Candidatus Aminicenantes bacterium]